MSMRFILIICASSILAACVTSAPQAPSATENSTLPTSNLGPGECGLFGWSTEDTREFVFYADANTARYDGADGPVNLTAGAPFPATAYTDPDGNSVILRLGEGETMNGGMRYPRARIVTRTDDGWERLHPVAIVQSCQPETASK